MKFLEIKQVPKNGGEVRPFSQEANSVKCGLYEHYKGNQYEVLFVGRDEETLDEVVIYRARYSEREVWVRKLKLFTEEVVLPNGARVSRFRYLSPN